MATRSRRRQSQRRRRDILVGLGGSATATLLIGLLPAFHSLLIVNVITDVLLVAYIVLLVQMRQRSAEREEKLRYLPDAVPAQAADQPQEESDVTVLRSVNS